MYGWSPQTIQQQGGSIPEWFGRNKLYGNIISSYIDNDGDQSFINVLISLGYGPFSDIPKSTMMINDQPIGNFAGPVQTPIIRLGQLNQNIIPQFCSTRIDTPQSRKVTFATPVLYTTVADNFDDLEIEISCPSGLFTINNKGGYDAVTIEARVEISPASAGTWTTISPSADNHEAISLHRWSAGYWMNSGKSVYKPVAGVPVPARVKLWYEVQSGDATYSRDVWNDTFGESGGWENLPYHAEGDPLSGQPEAQWHWFDGTTSINMVNTAVDYFDITGNAAKILRRVIRVSSLTHGQYDIRVSRLTADSTDDHTQDDLYLTKVTTATLDVQEYPREALVAIRALATDQLSGSLRFSVVADCKLLRVYDGGRWSVQFSRNPAWVIWHIFTRPVFNNDLTVARYDGYDPAKLDLPKFSELATRCDTLVPDGNGGTEVLFRFDGGFDSDGNVWSAAMQVAEECGAVPFWNGFKITLAIDQPATAESGFGMGNIIEGSYEETWLPIADRATEVEVTFRDEERDYQQSPYTVMDSDNPAAAPNKTQRQAVGITRPSAAWRYGLYKVKCNQILLCGIKFQIDVESIACTLGDCFNFSNDWPQWGFSGRTVSATTGAITLDREVTVEAAKTYQVMVIHPDGSSSTRAVSNVPGAYTTLTVGAVFTTVPALYDLYFFGETNLIAKPFIITRIEPAGDLQATIYGMEYNASLQGVYTGDPVLPTPNYSALVTLPPVTGLAVHELLTKRQDGTIDDWIVGSFDIPASSTFAKGQIWVSTNGAGMIHIVDSNDGTFRFSAQEASDYTIVVVTVNAAGETMPLAAAPLITISAVGLQANPADVLGLAAELTRGQMRIYWDAVADVDVAGYAIQIGTIWDASGNAQLVDSFAGTSYPWTPDRTGTISILVKALDTTGHYSINATRLDYVVNAPGAVPNSSQQTVDNNVLLYWGAATPGTFQIDAYEIRRGTDFASATVIGRVKGTFSGIFEMQSGTYKYWVVAVDEAGLYGVEIGLYATVSQPPDFVLHDQRRLDPEWIGTLTNCYIDSDGSMACLINTTETFEEHFDNNVWGSPQDQIDGGYPIYAQPGTATASYEETIDYGATIASTKITMDVTRNTPAGTVTVTPTISVSINGSDWTDYADQYQTYASGFRYVKYRLDMASSDGAVLRISAMDTRLDMKQKTYEGKVTCAAADSGGTVVDITGLFMDVSSIQITAQGTTPVIAIYDFVDNPNPTEFKILLFNTSGARVDGTASYIIRGV